MDVGDGDVDFVGGGEDLAVEVADEFTCGWLMGSACDDDVGGSQVMEVLLAVVGVDRRGCVEAELDLSD